MKPMKPGVEGGDERQAVQRQPEGWRPGTRMDGSQSTSLSNMKPPEKPAEQWNADRPVPHSGARKPQAAKDGLAGRSTVHHTLGG